MKSSKTLMSLPLAELVEDMAIYPRHAVDESHVSKLCKALEAGETLPPVVADEQSKKLTDGWHRTRAYRRVLGAGGVIDVELRQYKNDGEMLLDAIAMNASHGRALDKVDTVRCVVLAQKAGIEIARIAVALKQTVNEVQKLTVRVATVPSGSPGTIPGTVQVALKRPVQHLVGSQLTKEQAKAQASVPGTSYLLLAHQLYDAIHLGLANQADGRLMEALRKLRDELNRYAFPAFASEQ